MKDLVYITIIDFEMHRATCWKWKRNDVTNHLFLRTSFFPLLSRQCIQKNYDALFSPISQDCRQNRRKSGFGRQNVLFVNHNFVSQWNWII